MAARYGSLKGLERVVDIGFRIPLAGVGVAGLAILLAGGASLLGWTWLDEPLKWTAFMAGSIAIVGLLVAIASMTLVFYIEKKIDTEIEGERALWKMMATPRFDPPPIEPRGISYVTDITHIFGVPVTVSVREHVGHKEGFVEPSCPECRHIIDEALDGTA